MDTIAAISTIQAPSAIGILRMTGPDTVNVLNTVFEPFDGKSVGDHEARSMVLGRLKDTQGRVIDECLCVWFQGPNSYTGEDIGEIHTHGSPIVLQEGLRSLFKAGARQAKRGEFTKRGFLNGRMDLTQAEAVIDLIESGSAEAARNAVAQVDGVLRRQVEEIYHPLMNVMSQFYALVDYPDEDIEELQMEDIRHTVHTAADRLDGLLSTFERGQLMKDGVPTAIVGRPNAGKSSLLNALLGYERAIVTDIPGTTRDTVEEKAVVGGVLLRLIDTAGLRETQEVVEKIGVERSFRAAEQADLVLAVLDAQEQTQAEDISLLQEVTKGKRWILVWSKRDLHKEEPKLPEGLQPTKTVYLSSVTGEGIQDLEEAVKELYPAGTAQAGSILTNPRQMDAGMRALTAIRRAEEAMVSQLTADVVLTDAEEAMAALGELIGKEVKEDLVETIFSRFCVGK